jgi:hypothetical protein
MINILMRYQLIVITYIILTVVFSGLRQSTLNANQ